VKIEMGEKRKTYGKTTEKNDWGKRGRKKV
jgi:hypothetical protein